LAQLTALQDNAGTRPAGPVRINTDIEAAVQALLACLAPGAAPHAVSAQLEQGVAEVGLAHFVDHYLPAFNRAVGAAWASARLGVHTEHHYTESVRNVVLCILSRLHPSQAHPRVLLTTPPGELHGLGLLALQAALTLRGADCISLGTQTPVTDVVQAVHDLDTALVALSVSINFAPAQLLSYVTALRQQLPVDCRLWVGGQGAEPLLDLGLAGVAVFQSTGQAVQAWHQLCQELA
jgi:methanogenic corrinoid protein MtbC1